jgi:uncharacterized protein YecT (DUF1311 family)
MKRLGIGICWTLICGSASAQVPSEFAIIDAELKTCVAKADGVTPAIDNCNEQARTAADLILNRVYRDWVEQLKHPAKDEITDGAEILNRLMASERAWISYRDTSCKHSSAVMAKPQSRLVHAKNPTRLSLQQQSLSIVGGDHACQTEFDG